MYKKMVTLALLSLLVFQPANSAQNKYNQSSSDQSLWTNQFTVLLADDANAKKTRKVIEKILAKDFLDMPLGTFKKHQPTSASTLLRMLDSSKNKKSSKSAESAREKLGRYLVINYPDGVDLESIFETLKADSDVSYVSITEELPPSVFAKASLGQSTNSQIITEYTLWGYNKMRAAQAANYVHGHAYIGVVDRGIDMQHPDFVDYIGNTWMGGNYHPGLSFSVGKNAYAHGNPTPANPYSGVIGLGNADEYHLVSLEGDNCDLNNSNGTSEDRYVGHGTHVAGIIAANGAGSGGVNGICSSCSLSIAQFIFPQDLTQSPSDCLVSASPHYDGSIVETWSSQTVFTLMASVGFAIDIGVQIINHSGGLLGRPPGFCSSHYNSAECLVLTYAHDRDVMYIASAGNEGIDVMNFPAHDSRVIGVSGLENLNGGQFWGGSNFGVSSAYGPTFSAPARDVYSTFYRGKRYNPWGECDEHTDGDNTNGYGYCTGTSMSAPFISGVAGLVRSVNPLLSRYHVQAIMQVSIGGSYWLYDNQLGYGTPRADVAVLKALGVSGGVSVLNRLTPLFSMYGDVAGDIAQTTKPQVALAYNLNTLLGYIPFTDESVVPGFSFSESSSNPPVSQPRADIYLLTTHRVPPTGRATTPLYRQHVYGSYGGNPNDADWVLVLESELSGSTSFKSAGYEMDGIAGYIYTLCTPEPDCIPQGAVPIYRAYHSQRDDHAVFTAAKVNYMQSLGYSEDLLKLGYAYPNIDSDTDGIIDGMEYILGTDPYVADSDCDGVSDSMEYPMTGIPQSDPLDGTCPVSEQTPWGSNSGSPTAVNIGWHRAMGYHFTPEVNGSVIKLGGYFNGTKTVRLFNKTTGTLLATTTVTSNNAWSYISITPVAVTAGETYTVAAYIDGSGGSDNVLDSAERFPKTFEDITINGGTNILTTTDPDARPINNVLGRTYGQADITFIPN